MKPETLESPKAVLAGLQRRLKSAGIPFVDCLRREGAYSLDVVVPGERWEIDVLDDASVEIEVFKSEGDIYDSSKVNELLRRFGESPAAARAESPRASNGGTPPAVHHKRNPR